MKLENLNSTNPINSKISFGGYKNAYKEDGRECYKFYPPNYDHNKYKLTLEVATLDNKNGSWEIQSYGAGSEKEYLVEEYETTAPKFANDEPVLFIKDKHMVGGLDNFGYRFKFTPKKEGEKPFYYNDAGLLTQNADNNGKFNVIIKSTGGISKGGPMYHIFPDSYNPSDKAKKDFKSRTHFNVAGGNIQGIISKLKEGELDPYKLIISTPLFGKDEVSSHGYWPVNHFQISSLKGGLEDFKQLNVELFKEGKQFVADGAFTSQGFQSPFLQHALKWGKSSPYYNWFKFDLTSDEINPKIKLGVIPDVMDPLDKSKSKKSLSNFKYRLVNAPGDNNHNSAKPTYIQFYDKRLVTEEQMKRADGANEIIAKYEKHNTEDLYDIYSHQGSILPYSFEINPNDKSKMKELKEYRSKTLADIPDVENLFEFENFVIGKKSQSGGANFWAGQLDLVKMNLSNPKYDREDKNAIGSLQAKNSLYDVATYWTKTTHDALMMELVKNPNEIAKVAKKNGIEDKTLEKIKANINTDKYRNNLFRDNLKTDDFIMNEVLDFPLESIEMGGDITAILGSPYFKPSVVETYQREDGKLELLKNAPSKEIYNSAKFFIKNTLMYMDEDLDGSKKIFNGTELTEYGKFIAKVITPELTKFAILKALSPNDAKAGSDGIHYSNKIPNIMLHDIVSSHTDPKSEAEALVSKMKTNIKELGGISPSLAKFYNKEFENTDLASFKLAQAVVEHSGAGLNWRFDAAKDVADLDSTKSNPDAYSFEAAVDDMIDFWAPFVSNIKKHNPNSLSVAEITNFWDFKPWGDFTPEPDRLGNETNEFVIRKNALGGSENAVMDEIYASRMGKYGSPDVAERIFYEKTGATTGSNYSNFFSVYPEMYDRSVEHGTNNDTDVNSLYGQIQSFLQNGTGPFIENSHIFSDNHDKPRVLHSFSLDTGLFLSDFRTQESKNMVKDEDRFHNLFNNVDLPETSSKGIAAAESFIKEFDIVGKKYNLDVNAINKAIFELAIGAKANSTVPDKGRSEAFGFRPFEVTVKDIIERSKIKLNPKTQKQIENEVVLGITETGREKLANMWEVMCSVVGVPTLFNGAEFSQTGYETPSLNKELGCRGIILHNRAKEENGFGQTYAKIRAISGLAKQKGLSALSGGAPILLQKTEVVTKDSKGNDRNSAFFPIYKYDDKGSEVISVISDIGTNRDQLRQGITQKVQTDAIPLQTTNSSTPFTTLVNADGEFSRKVLVGDKYVDDGIKYVIGEDGKSLVREDGKTIVLNAGANIFYRTNNKTANQGNPKIDLHNMQYKHNLVGAGAS